uniref:Putative metallophosphoesterase At3g03305 n=1 Tax=Anthurium amnicola TaxID=1678845 RepID=A0A1D1YMW8_9ARAE
MPGGTWVLLSLLFLSAACATASSDSQPDHGRRRSIIDVEGGPDSVVWVVQLSDLHFSVFHPERALDFSSLVGPALAMIKPSLVLITGDLTDGKSEDLLTMKQNEKEWMEYQKTMMDVIGSSGLDQKIFYDLRGNHDKFGVPEVRGTYDFYQEYSVNAGLGRRGNVHSVTLQKSGRNYLFVGFDSTMEVGLRGPTNLFGHPTDQLLTDIDLELSQWNSETAESPVTKISFGHFPLSFSAVSDSGKSLKDVFLKHSLSAYLCGHLHSRFGRNLKRHHSLGDHFLSTRRYYQLNIHEGALVSNIGDENCSVDTEPAKEFWEWEMGDWRKSRTLRILAIDAGHVSFVDVNFISGSRKTIILPTFPLDSRLMQRISSRHEYNCLSGRIASYETVRALVFSAIKIVTVSLKIYDSRSGKLDLVLDSAMEKEESNRSRGDLYIAPWNWRAFVDPSPDRYWMQVEAVDITGSSSFSELRTFSVNGLTAKVVWKWKEFLVMGCHWASIYRPILWLILPILFGLLLIPRVLLIWSKNHYSFKSVTHSFYERSIGKFLLAGSMWILTELSKLTFIWSGLLVYLLYLTFFPWFSGNVFTDSGHKGYMTHKGWDVKMPGGSIKKSYVGSPDVMVIVLPHLCFVVLPAVLVMAALAAEKAAYRVHYMSLSGKKQDDYIKSKRHANPARSRRIICFRSRRWIRNILLLFCLAILWKHWKSCRALGKAYEMNPLFHSFTYCFPVPLLMACAVYKTTAF